MVKPGGTGTPRFVISARPAPFPPRTSFILPCPSAAEEIDTFRGHPLLLQVSLFRLTHRDTGNIRHRSEQVGEAFQERQPVVFHPFLLRHHEDFLEKRRHERLEPRHLAERLGIPPVPRRGMYSFRYLPDALLKGPLLLVFEERLRHI